MKKKLVIVANNSFSSARKKSLVDNVDYWCNKRGIEYAFCSPSELKDINSKEVGAVYRVLTSATLHELTSVPDDIPLIMDVATPLKMDVDIFPNKRIAFRNAFAQSLGVLIPEIQVPMLPRPIFPKKDILRDIIVFDVKQFHNEETHFYVMSLLAQVAREWKKLEENVGHKLYLYFTSFMKYEEYVKVFDLLGEIDQFGGAKKNFLKEISDRVIEPIETTEQYHDILHRTRLFVTEHGDIADTDLAQVLCLGTPILTYKRIPFTVSTGIQQMAKKAGVLLDKDLLENIQKMNKFRMREEWGLQNIIKVESVPKWDFNSFESMFLKSWDILWDWALNGTLDKELSEAMTIGGWNKGVRQHKKGFNELWRIKRTMKENYNMKIGIIGAGISGLSLANLLKNDFDVEILESSEVVGGIARTKKVNGITYHTVGGHCFNSKYEDVMDFVFKDILEKNKWHLVQRDAKILFKDHLISYPIEFAMKEIDKIDTDLAFKMTSEILNASQEDGKNLQEWFENYFGKTLATEYFVPYNKKIWKRDPKDMDSVWIKDKLPIPSKYDFYHSLIKKSSDNMPHAKFYYPNSNDQNTFISALALNLDCTTNYKVEKIEKKDNKWIVNDEKVFDLIINTSPLDKLGKMLKNVPTDIQKAFNNLKYNKVSNVLWKTNKPLESTWTYIPSSKSKIHRIINIGTFFNPTSNYCITEIMGDIPYADFIKEAKNIDYLDEPLDYNVSDHAYVVFDSEYSSSTKIIFKFLDDKGLYTHGRFGEWEYYNMDVCIKKSIDLSNKILKEYKSVK